MLATNIVIAMNLDMRNISNNFKLKTDIEFINYGQTRKIGIL